MRSRSVDIRQRERKYLSTRLDADDVIEFLLTKYPQTAWHDVELVAEYGRDPTIYADVGYLISYDSDYIAVCEKRTHLYLPFYLLGWDIELLAPNIYL